MATNPYAGLTNLIGMTLRADAQQDMLRFREEDLDFRRGVAEQDRLLREETNRISEIRANASKVAADVAQSKEQREIEEANLQARETYAYQTLNVFSGRKFNGEFYIDDNGNLNEEVFAAALSAGEDIAKEYAIGIGNKFGFRGDVKDAGFRVTSLVTTRRSGSLPEGQQGPVRPGTELGSGLSSLTGRVNPNKQTGEQLYSLVGQYEDGSIAPLTQDGSTSGDAPIVEATAAQIARMAALDWRSNVKGTTVGGTTLNMYRTGVAANKSLTIDQINKEDQKDLLLGQVDTATEAMARENPEIRREFISMLSDPDLSQDEQDEMVLEFAKTVGLDIPSILTTEGPKQFVGGDPDQSAIDAANQIRDPSSQISSISGVGPQGYMSAAVISGLEDRKRTPAGRALAKARIDVARLDNEIEKLRADPNKSAELAEKQLERNTLVYKANGNNLLDIKEQIKNTEQSIAQDATGDTSDLAGRLNVLREKEKQLLDAGVRTEEMETEAYKNLEEQLFGKENLVELLQKNSPETFEKLKKEAEAKVEAGVTPNASAATDFQRVLEGLGVTNDLRQAQNIPIKEQIMLRSILAAQAKPGTERLALYENYDAVVGLDTRTQGEIEAADTERVRIIGDAVQGIINAESNKLNAETTRIEQQRLRDEYDDPIAQQERIVKLQQAGLDLEKARRVIQAEKVKDFDRETEKGEELEETLTAVLLGYDRGRADSPAEYNRNRVKAGEASRKLTNLVASLENRARRYTVTETNPDGTKVVYFTNELAIGEIQRQSNRSFSTILQKLAKDEEGLVDNSVYMQLNDYNGEAVGFNEDANEFVVLGPDGVKQGGSVDYEDVERLDVQLARSLKIMADINQARAQMQ